MKKQEGCLPIIIGLPIILPVVLVTLLYKESRKRGRESFKAARHAYAKRETKKGLSRSSERSLSSLDLTRCPTRTVIEHNQRTSTFLSKLPLEMRQAIYDLYYDGAEFTLNLTLDSSAREACRLDSRAARAERRVQNLNPLYGHKYRYQVFIVGPQDSVSKSGYYRRYTDQLGYSQIKRGGLLELPLTCRQIYSESIDYMYRNNTFGFVSFYSAVAMPEIFLPQRLQALASIHLSFHYSVLLQVMGFLPHHHPAKIMPQRMEEWRSLWRTLASLPQLKCIRVDFAGEDISMINKEICLLVFEPLLKFEKQLVEFDVCFPWVVEGLAVEGAPFRLVQQDGT